MRYLLCFTLLLSSACAGDRPDWTPLDSRAEVAPPGDGAVKEASGGDTGPGCGSSSCSGCCIVGLVCATGASHTQCGSGGGLCVDCTKIDPNASCVSGSCSNCTPTCTGKLCGALDGCGGKCTAGSGCTPPCVDKSDANTLVLFTFEGSGSTVTDTTGKHHGKLVGSGAARVSGKTYCGKAMGFSGGTPASYVEIPDSADFDLTKGAVDFWVRFDATASGSEGVFSRDASGTANAGHITMMRLCNNSLLLRLQDTTNSYNQCSDPISATSWHHVGVNFGGTGGLKLYVDGTLANRTASITCGTDVTTCGDTATGGISGNNNPWVLGGASWTSAEGSATPVDKPLKGQIDSFRVSKDNRSF